MTPSRAFLEAVLGTPGWRAAVLEMAAGRPVRLAPELAQALRTEGLCQGDESALQLTRTGQKVAYQLSEYRTQVGGGAPAAPAGFEATDDLRVLDIGCGAGQTLVALGVGGARVAVGLDLDPLNLEMCAAMRAVQAAPALAPVCGDAERLPFGDRRFDRVLCRVTLMYVHVPRVVREIARVTAPGGLLHLHLTDTWFYLRKLLRGTWERGGVPLALVNGLLLQATGRQVTLWPGRTMNYQTVRGVGRLLRAAGFDLVSVQEDRAHRLGAAHRQPKILARRR